MMAVSVASKVPFYQLSVLLDKISDMEGKDRKKKLLKDFIDEWRAFHIKLHGSDGGLSDSFFPAMRLLLPHLDRSREAYGIKEHTLAKLYIEILGLGKDSPSAQKLIHFRAPKTAKNEAGDFAAIAFLILKPRCPDRGTLTIADVNQHLDEVANGNASKNKGAVRQALGRLLRQLSAREQKWLIRIVMKEMKMGLSQQAVLHMYHEDAEDLYNVKMNLEKVCVTLRDPHVRLHEIEISLFSTFRPMLGDRINPHEVEKVMKNRPFFVEIKYDGERMQMHKKDGEFKYFSRSGNEYTQTYGSNRSDGNLTPYIADCFKSTVQSCILDGEMVGFNPDTKTIGSKGENFDIKSRDVSGTGYQPMLCVFDILFLNGEVLANRPLRERRSKLADVFNPVEGRLKLSDISEKSTKQDCIDALNDAIDWQEEGIMVKDPESIYKPATRKGGWYKLKPEYVAGLMDELDVLVVGGYFGVGSRSQMLSHFLCAVAVPSSNGEHPKVFQSFCRVGSGYTKKELYDFNRRLAPHWKAYEKKSPPTWLELASGLKQRPDAYIDPEHSTILQIKATEIIASDQYKTNYTLRFPRVEKIRDDKPWYSCMTVNELEDLRQKSSGKLTGQHMAAAAAGDDEAPKKKRARIVHNVKPTVMNRFRGVDASTVTKTSEIFSRKEFCMMISSNVSKSDLERKVLELGGTVVQNPGSETFCVVADKISLKVKNVITKGCYDVVTVEWLQRCVEQKTLAKWIPTDMVHTSHATAAEFACNFDRYGDSYYDDTTIDDLQKTFDKIPSEDMKPVSAEQIAEIETEYFPHDSEVGLFRLCRVYLDHDRKNENSSLDYTRLLLRLYGATIVNTLNDSVTIVVVDSRDTSRVPRLQEVNRRRRKRFQLVSASWVSDCIERGKLLEERPYRPVLDRALVSVCE